MSLSIEIAMLINPYRLNFDQWPAVALPIQRFDGLISNRSVRMGLGSERYKQDRITLNAHEFVVFHDYSHGLRPNPGSMVRGIIIQDDNDREHSFMGRVILDRRDCLTYGCVPWNTALSTLIKKTTFCEYHCGEK